MFLRNLQLLLRLEQTEVTTSAMFGFCSTSALYGGTVSDTGCLSDLALMEWSVDPQPPNFSRIRRKIITGRKSAGNKCG